MADSDDDEVTSSTDPVVSSVATLITTPSGAEMVDSSVGNIVKVDIPDDGALSADALTSTSVSPSMANPTLHGLLSTPVSINGGQLLSTTEGIQIIAVSNPSELLSAGAGPDGRVWQVVHPDTMATIIAVADPSDFEHKPETTETVVEMDEPDSVVGNEMSPVTAQDAILMPPPPPPPQSHPPDWPVWTQRMKCCEKIGDSYRGYVETEAELDLLLTYHKQYTQSFWGTRQSPSPAKPSTRLMWKSQYVPFDGQPFINSGSRAVVMECQFGPRRKGNFSKKHNENMTQSEYKQTCPARIYIKKVKKFPEYAVDMSLDKKSMKPSMDKAFHELKQCGSEGIGQERYYVQLPTEKSHEFHTDMYMSCTTTPSPVVSLNDQEYDVVTTRLDPRVVQKIRDLVAAGESRVYAVRKALRAYVSRDLYHGGEVPERHNLTLFPTVNDLKNQIHQALKDIENGSLALTSPPVKIEILGGGESAQSQVMDGLSFQAEGDVEEDGDEPVPETVTVTLTQNPGDDGHHVISRIETHLSDGSTRISTTLTPETARLLSRLHPNMFPASFFLQHQMDQAVSSISTTNSDQERSEFTEQSMSPSVTVHGDGVMVQSNSDLGNSDSDMGHSDSVLHQGHSVISDHDNVISVNPLQIDDSDMTNSRQHESVDSLNVSMDTGVDNSDDADPSSYVAVSLSSDNGEHILGEAAVASF